MNYLSLLGKVFSTVVAVGQAIYEYGPEVLTGIETIYADLKQAWSDIDSAISGGTTLSDERLAEIEGTIATAQVALAEERLTTLKKASDEKLAEKPKDEDKA